MKADTLIYGGTILNPGPAPGGLETLEAVALREGSVLAAGRVSELEPLLSPTTRRIDLEGQTLLPGFNDAHVHVWKVGQLRTTLLDLRSVESLEAFYTAVRERAKTLQPGQWLWGRGWNEARMGGWPDRSALDAIAPRNPVLLTRTCAHIHAVNTPALQAAGITPETHVPGGEIDFGRGILYETAYGLVFKAMPAPTQADYERWVLAGLEYLKSLGITSATDPAVDPPLYAAYRALDAAGKLPIRVNLLYIRRPDGGSETFPLPEKHVSDFLRCDSVKFFADGGLSGATAAISQPYKTLEPPSSGILRFESGELYELALEAHRQGFRIGTHAIGDRALNQVLDVYRQLYEAHPSSLRHRIEHFGLAGEEHLELARRLGVIAVPQPVFLHELRGNFLKYLPEAMLCRCYNLRAMFAAGLTVAFSSDGPVVSQISPLIGLQAAVAEPMCEGHGVSLETALWAYTVGGALAQGDEGNRGRLEPGHWADFVLLDRDPRTAPPEALGSLEVRSTWTNRDFSPGVRR
ncbi:amidohydrolase [Calidithermus roseus]|uniref:N-substituted formamide deformylase n=1 Tax=Calidithermus roseus TaxID=1644118 RepID=A0A399ESH6_9DEIN|nr:amidohydrolase [Calidithermus roseus]RIH87564.1 N-substituted formamide deformylase [Calidithermus roseus]